MNIKKTIILVFLSLFVVFFYSPLGFAGDIFAIEYNSCINKCGPKEICCKETCGYKACIKHNTTRETATGAELTDPGAGDTAMAVCYPHLDVMKKCFDKNKPSFDLTTLREEFCTLSVAKAKKYTSKEACVLEMKKAEEAGQRGPEELVKIYSAGISAYKR